MPFSRGSSRPRDRTSVSYGSCIAGRFFTTEPLGKPLIRNIFITILCNIYYIKQSIQLTLVSCVSIFLIIVIIVDPQFCPFIFTQLTSLYVISSTQYNLIYAVVVQLLSCVQLLGLHGLQPPRLLCPWDSQARILEWAAISSSSGSFRPRDRTFLSYIAGRFFTTEPPGKLCTEQSFF